MAGSGGSTSGVSSLWATSIRHALTPYLRHPGYAYGGLAMLLVPR